MSANGTSIECEHLDSVILQGTILGYVNCPDCGKTIRLNDVFNNLLDAMRAALAENKKRT